MIDHEDLAVFYGRARAGYETLQYLPQKLSRFVSRSRLTMHECNAEEKRIAKLFDEGLFKIAEALDALHAYTWGTHVSDQSGRVAEDAVYKAQEEARREFGELLEVICVERIPTDSPLEILWRVTMRLPEETDEPEEIEG